MRHRIIKPFLSNTSNKTSAELDINYFFSYFCLSKKGFCQDDNDCSCEPAANASKTQCSGFGLMPVIAAKTAMEKTLNGPKQGLVQAANKDLVHRRKLIG